MHQLQQYRRKVHDFQQRTQRLAAAAHQAILEDLARVDREITNTQLELEGLRIQLIGEFRCLRHYLFCHCSYISDILCKTAAGSGLAASALIGVVGAFASLALLGPLGPIVAAGFAIVGIIGAAVSIGFMIDIAIRINTQEDRLAGLHNEKAVIMKKQADIESMLGDVTRVSESLDEVASYSAGFEQVWQFINNQIAQILAEFNTMPSSML